MRANKLPLLLAAAFTAAAVATPSPAYAWKHIGLAWCNDSDIPVKYWVADDYVEDSLDDQDFKRQSIENAYHEWEVGAPCAGLSAAYQGTCENTGPISNDLQNHFTYDDPSDQFAVGILGVTMPGSAGPACFSRNGQTYRASKDRDIVFNDNVDWATDEQIAAGTCNGETSLESVTTHEIGHQFGLGHSCDDGEACTLPKLREATMFWTASACDLSGSSIAADDIEGITAIYGQSASIECSNELDPEDEDTIAFGVVPFDLRCSIQSDWRDELVSANWSFGDGTEDETGLDVAHSYETAGNFSLQVAVEGENDECGTWSYTARRVGYVRACAIPEPEFTFTQDDGLTYNLLNNTDVSVYGCIYDIQWDIFKGDELIESLKAWEPQYTFPEAGEYRIVLNIGGPAGTGAAELTIDAKKTGSDATVASGCNQTSAAPAGAVAAMVALLAIRRRRSV